MSQIIMKLAATAILVSFAAACAAPMASPPPPAAVPYEPPIVRKG